ncbi:MAG: hypothetical protein JWO88_952 [Frankiales bacterium]|nr:hypothetical protein [Frankiales bacterium]
MSVGRRVGAALVLGLLVAGSAQGATPRGPSFGDPVTVITSPLGPGDASSQLSQRPNTGEPRLIVSRSGRVLLSAQFQQWDCATRKPSSVTAECVWVSDDGGKHFHISGGIAQQGDDVDFTQTTDGTLLMSAMANPKLVGDSTGTGFLGSVVLRSTDDGRTWSQADDVNNQVANDRPFIVSTPHAAVLTYLAIPGTIQAVRSTDGGKTWGLPIVVAPTPPPGLVYVNATPAYDAAHGELLAPYLSSSKPYCAANTTAAAGCMDQIDLATSRDEGLTWTPEHVTLLAGERPLGMTTVTSLAVDGRGHRTIAFTAAEGYSPGTSNADHNSHVYAVSSDGPGRPWSAPRRIDAATGSAMMPMLATNGTGRISVAYYHSTFADAGSTARPWDFVVSDSRDGGRTWSSATLAHSAYLGSAANHQLVIWDLVGLTYDRRGRLVTAWTDQLGKPGGATTVRFATEAPV